MSLAFKGIIPTKEWNHNPNIVSEYNETVAMLLAMNKIIPPKEWFHDPNL